MRLLFLLLFSVCMRLELRYKNNRKGENLTLYSNDIKASINPAQLWRYLGFTMFSIMEADFDE